MGNDTLVYEKECKLITEHIDEQLDRDEKRLNGHSADIKELTQLVTELAATNAQLVKTQELLIKNLEAQEKRIKSLEDDQKIAKALSTEKTIKPWYESSIGQYVIKAGVLIVIMLLTAAIGLNALDALKVLKIGG